MVKFQNYLYNMKLAVWPSRSHINIFFALVWFPDIQTTKLIWIKKTVQQLQIFLPNLQLEIQVHGGAGCASTPTGSQCYTWIQLIRVLGAPIPSWNWIRALYRPHGRIIYLFIYWTWTCVLNFSKFNWEFFNISDFLIFYINLVYIIQNRI
jgi:hypothetical protein